MISLGNAIGRSPPMGNEIGRTLRVCIYRPVNSPQTGTERYFLTEAQRECSCGRKVRRAYEMCYMKLSCVSGSLS